MSFARNSGSNALMMGASGMAISFAFGGVVAIRNGGGVGAVVDEIAVAMGALALTGRAADTGGAGGESIRCKRPRNKPANLDLTMFDMTFVF
jgi:hypothetical protein